jgi:hypothetical protein
MRRGHGKSAADGPILVLDAVSKRFGPTVTADRLSRHSDVVAGQGGPAAAPPVYGAAPVVI